MVVVFVDDWWQIGVEFEIFVIYLIDFYQVVDVGDFDIVIVSFNCGFKFDLFFMFDLFVLDGFVVNFNWYDEYFVELMNCVCCESDFGECEEIYCEVNVYIQLEYVIIILVYDCVYWLVGEWVSGIWVDVQLQVWCYLELDDV